MDVSPANAGEVNLDGQAVGSYPSTMDLGKFTTVQLEAVPFDGWWFDQWMGIYSDRDNPMDLRVDCTLSVTAGFIQASYTSISSVEAKAMIDAGENDLIVIDVREEYEYCNSGGHIPGSLNYPWTSGVLLDRYMELPMESDILVICRSGNRSKDASDFLVDKGYRNIYEIGGINDWEWETVTCDGTPPEAKAGPDQTVSPGDMVTMDGSASIGQMALTYAWLQVSGPTVQLNNPESAVVSFTAPETADTSVSLAFELTVTTENDIQAVDSIVVSIIKDEYPPEADAGSPQIVSEAVSVHLDASGSTDPDGTISRYTWRQSAGPTLTLFGSDTAMPSFMAPPVESGAEWLLSFEVTVTDDTGLQASDTVSITVTDNGIGEFDANVYSFQTSISQDGAPLNMGVSITNGVFTDFGPFDTTGIDMNLAPEDLAYGIVDTVVMLTEAAISTTIHFHLPKPAPDNYAWYKYDTNGAWFKLPVVTQDGEEGVRFSDDRKTVSFTLIDNGDYDLDPTEGIIRDPSGLAMDPDYNTAPVAPDDGGDSGGSGGCFLSVLPF